MKKWLRFFYVVFIITVSAIIIFRHEQIKKLYFILASANPGFVIFVIFLQFFNFVLIALSYKTILKALSYKVGFIKLLNLSIVMTSLNSVYPSMSVLGNTALFHSLKQHHKVDDGKILITITLYIISVIISFIAVLLISLLLFILSKNLGNFDLFLLIANMLFIIVILSLIFSFVRNKKIFAGLIEGILSKIFKLFKRKLNTKKFYEIIDEYYQGAKIIKSDKKHFMTPILLLLMKHLIDIVSIYLIFHALNFKASFLIIVFGIAVANLISTISFIPSGIGIFEFGMAGSFAALGIDLGIAISAVLLFRLISLWIPVLLGFILYKSALKI